MADRTIVDPQTASRDGITPTWHAATASVGDSFPNTGKVMLHVKNAGSETVLTIQTPGLVDTLAVAERTVTIAATTGEKLIGPFPTSQYNQTNGRVYLDWSSVTSVTFAVYKYVD